MSIFTSFRFYIIDDDAKVWGTNDEEVARNANETEYSIVINAGENKATTEFCKWKDVNDYNNKEEDEEEEEEEE